MVRDVAPLQQTTIPALLQCSTVAQVLAQPRDGYVHSVFEHACNIDFGSKIVLTLQTHSMSLAPGACILPVSDMRTLFYQNEPISFVDSVTILSSNVEILLAQTPSHTLQLQQYIVSSELIPLGQKLLSFLRSVAPTTGFYPILCSLFWYGEQPLVLSSDIERALAEFRQWLTWINDTQQLANILPKLVGYGIGLTPSADDFLLGILLVMDAFNEPARQSLVDTLHPLLTRTTAISAAMLSNGCAGFYSRQLLTLVNSSDGLTTENLICVANYGHSSGSDMLCGMLFAVECLAIKYAVSNNRVSNNVVNKNTV